MIPESLHWPVNPYLLGGVAVVVGCVVGLVGAQIKSRNNERHKNQLYVRRKRGEDLALEDPPKIATVMEYLGGAVIVIGIMVLLAAWSLTPGQS
jgi:hypothetical protein